MRADAIFCTRPHTQALSELLSTRQLGSNFWVEPIAGMPPEVTLLGASGMDKADIDRMVAAKEAEHAITAALRESERTAKQDAEVAKLEAAAEAHLSAKVPSIATIEHLQHLEAFYGLEHAPLPSHRELPFHRVRFLDRMAMLYKNVERLA